MALEALARRATRVGWLAAGPACAVLAVLRGHGGWLACFGVAASAVALGCARRDRRRLPGLLLGLTLAWCAAAWARPELLRADSTSYYSYLRSLAFDHDLDFTNERQRWGFAPGPLTATGHRHNQFPVGPALVWSPFFLLAHAYVRVANGLGLAHESADGFSQPYLASEALGSVAVGILGCWCLVDVLRRRVDVRVAAIAVAASVCLSPIVFYLFFQPGMSHAICFGMTAVALWALDRVRRSPSLATWIVLGGCVGLLAAVRLQAVAFVLLVVPTVVASLRHHTSRLRWLVAAVGASALAFVPQLVAWKVLYGSFLHVPEGPGMKGAHGWFDAASPHLVDVLLSADHGLFTFSPGLVVATAGLLIAVRRWRGLALSGLFLLVVTTWANGARTVDWSGDDAFGARRFDLVIPFMAVGFAAILDWCRERPLAVPVGLLAGLALWNAGLVRLYRLHALGEATGVERLAAQQSRQLRVLTELGAQAVAGRPGRALAYKTLVGDYLYWNDRLPDTLAAMDDRHLAGGWSEPRNRTGPPVYRAASYPQACVRFALMSRPDRGLRTVVTARAAHGLSEQRLSVVLNGRTILADAPLGSDWSDVNVAWPAEALEIGENVACLRFGIAPPGEDEDRAAADVARIVLP